MKYIIILVSFLIASKTMAYKIPKTFTLTEKRFVKTVIKNQKEKVIEITKRKDSYIVLEFESTMVVLTPKGYIDQIWILEDADWSIIY